MPQLNQVRAENLTAIARQQFDPDLLPAELQVLQASSSSESPIAPAGPEPRPPVRPGFLRWLCTAEVAAGLVDLQGIRITSATIAGQLDLTFCRVSSVLRFHACTFEGEVTLHHSELRALFIQASAAQGILAHGCTIRGPLFLNDGFEASGPVDFHAAHIERGVLCTGNLLHAAGLALSLEGAYVDGDIQLSGGFRARGQVRLMGATINGDLSCAAASFNAVGGIDALVADRTSIRGNVHLQGIQASAGISFPLAQIGGEFNCCDGFLGTAQAALTLDGAAIQGGVFLRNLRSAASVSMVAAHVDRSLDCSHAILSAKAALVLDRAHVEGSLFLRNVQSSGAFSLSSARIEKNLDCRGASLAALYCPKMTVLGELIWTSILNPESVELNLAGASVGNFRDDQSSWPGQGNLIIDGFAYKDLSLHPPSGQGQLAINNLPDPIGLSVNQRIDWLRRQSVPHQAYSQPWIQLSSLLAMNGDSRGSKHVLFAMRAQHAKERGFIRFCLSSSFAWLQEEPLRILLLLAPLVLLGTLVFWAADHAMGPTDAAAYTAWATGRPYPSAYPQFQPLIYTLENALPLVKLGQDDRWAPDSRQRSTCSLTSYGFLTGFRWILIIAGWFQATLLAAAVGNRFKT